MSLNRPRGTHRRNFLATAGAAILGPLLPDVVSAQNRNGSIELNKAQLAELFSKPEWSVPRSDGSESAKTFYLSVATYERYYRGSDGQPRLRGGVERLLDNNGAHLKMILASAKKYGVPKEVVFLALAESHWSAFGENRAKAAGYWQFIPGTATMFGLQNVPAGKKRNSTRYTRDQLIALGDERLDPEKSTDAAMRFLVSLKRFFERIAQNHSFTVSDQDLWTFVMWAYNRGPGHVRKTYLATRGNPLAYPEALLGQPSQGTNGKVVRKARLESINYVPKILAIRNVVRSLHDGSIPKVEAPAPKRAPETPPAATPKPEIQDPRPEQSEREEQTEGEETVEIIEYRVQGGDNLTKIATWIAPDLDFVGLRMDQIREYNERTQNRKLKDQLNRNERLYIPAQRVDIQSGDTLDKFARTYYSGWPVPVAINYLRYINGLRPGMQLQAGKKVIVPLQNN